MTSDLDAEPDNKSQLTTPNDSSLVEASEPRIFCEIRAEIARRITFATHQCDVAIIADLSITNATEDTLEDLTLRLTCDPPLLGERTWPIDRISADSEFRLQDRRVSLSGGMLDELSERVRSELIFDLFKNNEIIAQRRYPVIALARNEWGGARHMPELLAAFVMPNDPAVQRILKEAADILDRSNRQSSLEGYQAKSRKRSWEIASAIWASVTARGLTYANPPASFEREGQKIRFPSVVAEQELATCLDTALLFASALEQAGLFPIVVFTEGHALTGVWLQPQSLPALTAEDPMEIRKAIAQEELILFETTMATGSHSMPFMRAIEAGTREVSEANEEAFIYAIDIRQARARGIQPLSSAIQATNIAKSAEAAAIPPPAALDEAPDLPPFEDELPSQDLGKATPAERLETWKRSLLDLSKRNRLLNLKTSNTTIPIFCPNPAHLEDMIAEGKRIKIITPPEQRSSGDTSDAQLRLLRTGEDAAETFAEQALARHEIVANTDAGRLRKGAIELYRKAKADFEEGGSNTLFLALGMLRWSPSKDSKQSYRAPLILLPVRIERASAASQPYLTSHDDEPVFNLTLLEMLRQDFQIDIPGLEGELVADESGIDVPRIWNAVRAKVRDVPGFEVVEDVVLSTFSFAKYLMWKDLSDRTEILKQAPFVEHVIDHPREPYRHGAAFIEPYAVDSAVAPNALLAPLNADSSQIVAIHASGGDGDFVLEGPPGTGKSETIANIIAHNIGQGRRVLFVSEKMAALDVVYRRLSEADLGDFCLELHSAKANKRGVLDQLGAAWDRRGEYTAKNWQEKTEKLARVRSDLNGLVEALHAPGPAGVSPRAAIGRVMRYGDVHRLRLDWPRDPQALGHAPDARSLGTLETIAKRLGQQFGELKPEDIEAFEDIARTEWSNAWASELIAAAHDLSQAIARLKTSQNVFAERIGLADASLGYREIVALASIAELVPEGAKQNLAFVLTQNGRETVESLHRLVEQREQYRQTRDQLEVPVHDDRIPNQPIERWITETKQAEARKWPMCSLDRRKLRKAMRTALGLEAKRAPQPEQDLPVLSKLSDLRRGMDTGAEALASGTPWRGLESSSADLSHAIEHATALREAVLRLASFGRDLVDLRGQLGRLFGEGRDLLEPGMPIAETAADLVAAKTAFGQALSRYTTAARDDQTLGDIDLVGLALTTQKIIDREVRLNIWCQWVEARREANQHGLGVLVAALENGTTRPEATVAALHTAYAAWLAPILIDERPPLRRFSSVQHEDLIATFRDLDREVAELSAGFIRANLSGDIPSRGGPNKGSGYGILARELQKKARHKPVRQLVSEMGDALTTLTPCLMMSPLSVAQFLPAETQAFDLVVFDEASQITVPDAVGAIARGKRCIIVGDPNQMPPTNFFSRSASDADDDSVQDLESILDEALAARLPHHRLAGHYRSRHESLITFSNHTYYGGDLVTYPSADTAASAVSFRHVEGVYAKGKTRTNEIEAKALVAEVLLRLRDPQRNHLSIGIVTLNSEQQRLIEDLLDQERRTDPELEPFFQAGPVDPIFVKNLETVQGDQRDVILLSIAYGPTEPGAQTMSMNFGPLNRTGGERRLNVAITRATSEVVVFASFDPGMIDLTRSSAEAVKDLKHYLEFAKRGPAALGEAVRSVGDDQAYDSDFERAVAERLRAFGWTIRTQVGVSKFRVDLGVIHPDTPGAFLAGVECDGATYHRSASARDRDRVRHIILENLGWRLLRIWSTDFFQDADTVMERTDRKLGDILEADRENAKLQQLEQNDETPETTADSDVSVADNVTPGITSEKPAQDLSPDHLSATAGASTQSFSTDTASAPSYADEASLLVAARLADEPTSSADHLDSDPVSIDPDQFYEATYRETLRAMAIDPIDREGPITFKRISDQIARTHGFQRTGKQIRQTIWQAIQNHRRHSRTPDGHTVFWPENTEPKAITTFRGLTLADTTREWREVPHPEKMGLVREHSLAGIKDEDMARHVAEQIGVGRVTKSFRLEIEALVQTLESDDSSME